MRGYIGRKKDELSLHPQIVINEVSTLLSWLDSLPDGELQKVSSASLTKINTLLVGASIVLNGMMTNVADVNTVKMLQRQLYNRHCFDIGAISVGKVVDPMGFVWISECFINLNRSFQYATMAYNQLAFMAMKDSKVKERAYALGVGILYEALINGNPDPISMSSALNPFYDDKVMIARQIQTFSEGLKDPNSKYLVYKAAKDVFEKKGFAEESDTVSSKMKEIIISNGQVPWYKKAYLHVNQWAAWVLGFLCLISLILFSIGVTIEFKKTSGNGKCTAWGYFKYFLCTLTGIVSTSGWTGLIRFILVLILGALLNYCMQELPVDLNTVVIVSKT
jgi:hypothetical protein